MRRGLLELLTKEVERLKEEQEELQRRQKQEGKGQTVPNQLSKSMTPELVNDLQRAIRLFQFDVSVSLSACEQQYSLTLRDKRVLERMQELGDRLLTDCETLLTQARKLK